MLPRLAWACTPFAWAATCDLEGDPRRARVQRVQGAENIHVLILNPPDGLCSAKLQDTINAWNQQHVDHALTCTPHQVFIALPFYRQQEDAAVKRRITLDLTNKEISLPVFTGEDSLQVTWAAYFITTAIVHLGEHTSAPWSLHNPRSNVAHFAQTCLPDGSRCCASAEPAFPACLSRISYALGPW